MKLEEKYAIALGVLSVVLWGSGWLVSRTIAAAPPRVIRTVVPLLVMFTFACFAIFVAIARHNVKG